MIFGTDGLRATMGQPPLTRETIESLSYVLASWLGEEASVVIGRDTRSSGSQVFDWITSHFGKTRLIDLKRVPTPVVAYETRARAARLGIMITASHNPACDNGLKFFDANGLKVTYDLAKEWSRSVESLHEVGAARSNQPELAQPHHYQTFIHEHFSRRDFAGLVMGFDLAHGAACPLVEDLANQLGISAQFIGNQPDGTNINDGLGALHPQRLWNLVCDQSLDVGFALDGDGDRLVAVDRHGVVHGDHLLYALLETYRREAVPITAVVGTIMCGMGLERRLAEEGIQLIRTPVGDQNVLASLLEDQHLLGGEPSGHIIQAELFPAGDGFLGALRLARALKQHPDLIDLARNRVPQYPVHEKALRIARKPAFEEVPRLALQLADLEQALDPAGRIILRYSGTEPKIRLYVEAPVLTPFQASIDTLEQTILEELG